VFQDYLLYATDVQTRYAFRVAHLSHLAQEAVVRHNLSGTRALMLSDVLTSGVLLASVLETEERVNLRIQCGSDFTVASETSCQAQTRGYIESLPDSQVLERIKNGDPADATVLVRTLRSLPGTSKLTEGVTQSNFVSVEQVVNEHLVQSFQSRLRLRVESWYENSGAISDTNNPADLRSYGVIYLELPNLEDSVEKNLHLHIDAFNGFRNLGARAEDPDVLVHELVPDLVRPINNITPSWQCTCSMASVEAMLLSLDPRELSSMASEREAAQVNCHYCGSVYRVEPDRLTALSLSAVAAKSSSGTGNTSQN
jgi:molecular chaperone Hsp33